MKKFILVLRNRGDHASVYVCSNLYGMEDLQRSMVHFDELGVDVIDILTCDIDLSKYEY